MTSTTDIVIKAAEVCAAEHAAQYESIYDGPETWEGDMYDDEIDHAGQMIGRPLTDDEINDFDAAFRKHFARLMKRGK